MVTCLKCKFLNIEYKDSNMVLGKCMNPPQDLKFSQDAGSFAKIEKPDFHYDYGKVMKCKNFVDKDKI